VPELRYTAGARVVAAREFEIGYADDDTDLVVVRIGTPGVVTAVRSYLYPYPYITKFGDDTVAVADDDLMPEETA
jgi:hypothetical protein